VVSVPPGWWPGIGGVRQLQIGKVFPGLPGFSVLRSPRRDGFAQPLVWRTGQRMIHVARRAGETVRPAVPADLRVTRNVLVVDPDESTRGVCYLLSAPGAPAARCRVMTPVSCAWRTVGSGRRGPSSCFSCGWDALARYDAVCMALKASSAACLIAGMGAGAWPVWSSICRAAWWTSMGSPLIRVLPACWAVSAIRVGQGRWTTSSSVLPMAGHWDARTSAPPGGSAEMTRSVARCSPLNGTGERTDPASGGWL
jgi:hypothetical protein